MEDYIKRQIDMIGRMHPVAFMVEELLFSDEALERFVEILMHTDADPFSKQRVLNDAVTYLRISS